MKRIGLVGLVLVSVLVGAVAFAAGAAGGVPDYFFGGFWAHPKSVPVIAANKVTRVLAGSATIDFAAGTIVCEDSTGITITGAQVGDPCFVGPPETLTAGGTGLHHNFTCYVSAADTVKVRACAAGTADNPGSVLYRVRVISSQ